MDFKKMLLMGTLTLLIGAQCWGAGNMQEKLNGGLFKAVAQGDTAAVQALLAQRACVKATDNRNDNRTVLHCAAEKGKADTVLALLAAKACVDTKDRNDNTALCHAASTRHKERVEVVKLLLRNNASVNTCNKWGKSALYEAAEKGHADAVLVLLMARAYVDTARGRGCTALHSAAFWGHDKVVRLLIDNGASIYVVDGDDFGTISSGGGTPLCKAASQFEGTVMSTLIDAHYNELIKRFPVIIDMGNGNLVNQAQVVFPNEVLELIVKNFSPRELANFRSVCKYFRALVSEQFENIRKKCAIQLKKNLIGSIEAALHGARNRCPVHNPVGNKEEQRKKAAIALLEMKLDAAKKLKVEGLLRGVIDCDDRPHFGMTQIDSDLGSQVVAME